MRLIIGIFIAFAVAALAYDLGLRLPLDAGIQFGLLGALGLASWAAVSSLTDDEQASHRH